MPVIDLPYMRMSYSSFGDESQPPLVFLHGIMGNKKNLEHFVKKLLEDLKASALIFDLRNHGESTKHLPCTVQACADDVALACELLKIKPVCVYGHSFGGKVGLVLAKKLSYLKQVWLLDCPPGTMAKKPLRPGSLSAFEIIDKLRQVKFPINSRNDLVTKLLDLDTPRGLALWMTTNLRQEPEGFYLNFYPDEIEKMLSDFIALDLWPQLQEVSKHTEIHLLAAEHGDRITAEDEKRWLATALPSRGFVHELKNSGHFVHVDNLPGLIHEIKAYAPSGL